MFRSLMLKSLTVMAGALLWSTLSVPLSAATAPAAPAPATTAPLAITVFGGTGNIGQRIVKEALVRGHQVTVVARDPSTLTLTHTGLAVARGDVLDTAQVTRQIAGQDVVISAIGLGRDNSQGNDFLVRAAQSLVAAIRAQKGKTPRLLIVGGGSTLQPGSPMTQRPAGMQQQQALDYLRNVQDVSWSYFSPAGEIRPGQRTGKFRLGSDHLVTDERGKSSISTEDYAVAMVDEAEQPAHVRQQFTVGY
jgi:putative NADH-flavin reductase